MRIEFDNTVALVKPETPEERAAYDQVRLALKTEAPGARYMESHKKWLRSGGKYGWDGKASILSKSTGQGSFFPTGMLPYVYGMIKGYPIELIDSRRVPKIQLGKQTVQLRDYQQEAMNAALNNTITMGGTTYKWPCGVLRIATGGGKTELAVAMYQVTRAPTVFVVHRKHLMSQAIRRFAKYGIEAGQIGDSVFDPAPYGITVATVQTLHNILKRADGSKISQFIGAEQIFFDEAHLCASKLTKGNQFVMLARQFRCAYYRWGLTATPFMKDEYSNQLLMGVTGDQLCNISNDQLIKAGHLTPPRVVIYEMEDGGGPRKWPECYERNVMYNEVRNDKIIELLESCPKPAFVMCSRLAHAKVLHKKAELKGISLPAIQCGSTTLKARDKVLNDLRSGTEKAIICTTIYDDGVDLENLRTLILAGGGKSQVAQLQRVGRGLRKAAGKHEVLVYDFKDTSGATLKRHSQNRKKYWKEEGFLIEEKK